ncbi:hypothetical protein ACPC54_04755 [Kitasatospora sp. NPDC094028]
MRVRLPDRRRPGGGRRRLPAIALVWSVVVAVGVIPIGLGAVTPAAADSSAVTVQGPLILDAVAGKDGDTHGSITVAQTKNLVNQRVHVSWTGFTKSMVSVGKPWPNGPSTSRSAHYQVRVYQCRGKDPKITDCYGSTLYNADANAGFQQKKPAAGTTFPDFPSNQVLAVTGEDGSGYADIELLTAVQSPSLGCDDKHPCSIVVEPNYGGDTLSFKDPTRKGVVNCKEHKFDFNGFDLASDAQLVGTVNQWSKFYTGEQCAWDRHVAIPLEFAPTPSSCPSENAAFSAAGLEPAKRAMDQWQTGMCQSDDPQLVSYGYANGDFMARSEFFAGGKDMALAARPDTQSPPPRPYVYAPMASSGISVVFVVDDPNTHRQIRDMKLDARLVAKLLTQSYEGKGSTTESVKGNPTCVFADPEFQKYNPPPDDGKGSWPKDCSSADSSPTVFGGISDLTYQLTSWLAADPDTVRFLDGEPDPWGMHVNRSYLRPAFSGYPVDSFIRQDSSGDPKAAMEAAKHWKQYEWNPISTGIKDVVRKVLWNQSTCVSLDEKTDKSHDPCAAMTIGVRTLVAIMDSGQAKAFALPEAQLLNPGGGFVAPDTPGFQAAVADMTVDPTTGVQSLPYGTADSAFSRDQKAYPLTTVDYAMLPTKGVAPDKVTAMTKFMRSVTTSGQVYGFEPGHLPPGFLALTGAQRAQATDAISHLESQDGKLPGNQAAPPNPPAPGDTGAGPAPAAGGGAAAPAAQAGDGGAAGGGDQAAAGAAGGLAGAAAAAPGAAANAKAPAKPAATTGPGKPLAAAPVAAGTPIADRSGAARLLLPVALIGGLVLLVGGPAALFLGGTPAGEKALAGARQTWARLRRRQ